jgi:hypothetical protein
VKLITFSHSLAITQPGKSFITGVSPSNNKNDPALGLRLRSPFRKSTKGYVKFYGEHPKRWTIWHPNRYLWTKESL